MRSKCPDCHTIGNIKIDANSSNTLKRVYRCEYVYPNGIACGFSEDEDTPVGGGLKILGGVAAALGAVASIIAIADKANEQKK